MFLLKLYCIVLIASKRFINLKYLLKFHDVTQCINEYLEFLHIISRFALEKSIETFFFLNLWE